MKEAYQLVITLSVLALVGTAMVFGIKVTDQLERIVVVAERTEDKLDAAIKAAAPVGRAAVEKGAEMIRNVDEQDMTESAERGLKEIGEAAKNRLIELLEESDRQQKQEAAPTAP